MPLTLISERTREFDTYVSSIDMAMREPSIAEALGGLATQIIDINDDAFLPIEVNGHLEVPRAYRDDYDSVAIVPVSHADAARASYLVGHLMQDFGDWQPLGPTERSPVSGYTQDGASIHAHMVDVIARARQRSNKSGTPVMFNLSNTTLAQTMSGVQPGESASEPSKMYFRRSRPVIVVDAEALKGKSKRAKAARIAHEEAHALDVLHNAAIYALPLGHAASELVGYFVTDTVDTNGTHALARKVNAWRENTLGRGNFVPDESHVPYLQSIDVI